MPNKKLKSSTENGGSIKIEYFVKNNRFLQLKARWQTVKTGGVLKSLRYAVWLATFVLVSFML